MSRRLKDKDVEDLLAGLENGYISEDEEGMDDLNEFDYYPDVHDLMKQFEDNNDYDEKQNNENLPLPDLGVAAWRQRNGELISKKCNLQCNEERRDFIENADVSLRLAALETPFQFFAEFISEDILNVIVEQTNLYIKQKNVSNCPPVNATEIRQFLGIIIFMSVYHYPNVRSYWGKYGFDHIQQTMTVNRFEKIRSVIHFNDNAQHKPVDHPNHDCLHKIRPVVEHLNKLFISVAPLDQRFSLEEQTPSTKMARFMKQYLSNKSYKWDFKLFVLCSLSGFAYNGFLGRYSIRIKSRKWYIRFFYYMIDMTVINSWVLYKKNNPNLTLGDYRSELAETLCSYKKCDENKRARPSNLEREIEAKKHRGPTKPIPPKDIRTDGIGHDEKRCSSKNRCKLPGCKGFSRTECIKCKVTLCHNKNRNCFAIFHS
ncbi:uncharacterized protein ACN2A1_014470 [Glossina fuscipes fuscipes]